MINALLDFVYGAGQRNYTMIRPGQPGAPVPFVQPTTQPAAGESLRLPQLNGHDDQFQRQGAKTPGETAVCELRELDGRDSAIRHIAQAHQTGMSILVIGYGAVGVVFGTAPLVLVVGIFGGHLEGGFVDFEAKAGALGQSDLPIVALGPISPDDLGPQWIVV